MFESKTLTRAIELEKSLMQVIMAENKVDPIQPSEMALVFGSMYGGLLREYSQNPAAKMAFEGLFKIGVDLASIEGKK